MSHQHTNKHRAGSPASVLMGGHGKSEGCNPAKILMGGHYAEGGSTMPAAGMSAIGSRRSEPNPGNRFAKGGHARAEGGQMQMEDKLMAEGRGSSKGSEMNKENRLRRATGGDIGTNTGSSIAKEPGNSADAQFKKGGRPKMMRRAMGGAGKTRKSYPFT